MKDLDEALQQDQQVLNDQLENLYKKFIQLEEEGFQNIIKYHDMDKTEKSSKQNWSIMGVIKQFFGLVLFLSLMKAIIFPTVEFVYSEDQQFVDRVDIKLNRTEYISLEQILNENERKIELDKLKI